MAFYVGIDVGGTFTDGVVADDTGRIQIFKVPSVPGQPSIGFMNCLVRAASSYGVSLEAFLAEVANLKYGTTIATNLLIEGKIAKTGLITTRGFQDTLIIQRIGREYLAIDLQVERPDPLTPRSLIEEITERVDATGKVITPLNMEDLTNSIERLSAKGVEAFAVCLLWSFKNPTHERIVREAILQKNPKSYVSISTDTAPLIGEYERTATTVMNASLGPPIASHLKGLNDQLKKEGLGVPLLLMQSTGGVTPAEDAFLKPITLVNSGPAGGVIAGKYIGELLGLKNIICIDMGGTSFDTSLVSEGYYSVSAKPRLFNYNVYVPIIDIRSIGAGGGSIAWVDAGRRLKVGPQSAGADPGPACYGKGGQDPTVTDANVVLGKINPDYFLGGEMQLETARAMEAIASKAAQPLGMDVVEAALGIRRVVDANMAGALRSITISKGYDPKDYTLLSFGGAGPVHAASLAEELNIETIVIPYMATVQSAFGVMTSDVVHTFLISNVMAVDNATAINECFSRIERQGLELLGKEGFLPENISILRQADMRYKGQVHEVTVPVPAGSLTVQDLNKLIASFEKKYEALYGRGTAFTEAGYEILGFRVDVAAANRAPPQDKLELKGADPNHALKTIRKVFFGKEKINTNIYSGNRLEPGNRIKGPAIIEYMGTTAEIPPGFKARIDGYLNLILKRRG
jgi:N-methylhydantoinase A